MAISYHASSLLTSRSPKKQNTETNLISREKKKAPEHFRVRELARQKGLEPLTYWFVASYSIQLSYCRMSVALADDL